MFRLIKKYYFKFYHLLKFLGIFIFVFGLSMNVKAEECNNLITNDNKFIYLSRYNRNYLSPSPTLNIGSTYTLYVLDGSISFRDYFTNNLNVYSGLISGSNLKLFFTDSNFCDLDAYSCTSSFTSDTTKIVIQGLGDLSSTLNEHIEDFHIVEGDSICSNSSNEPDNPIVDSNTPIIGFINIYVDRLGFLANGFLDNPYLFSFVAIIFLWCILELFLYLLKGRRK